MNPIPEAIERFLEANSVSTVCFVDADKKPYCINCFYVYDPKDQLLIFKSSHGTTHQTLTHNGAPIAGTVLPEKIELTRLKGLQFTGMVADTKNYSAIKLNTLYLKKYPMSIAIVGYVWAVKLNSIKLTDNTLGFGNKTHWASEKS